MTKVSRNDVFVRPEKGGEWFNEFLRICREQQEVLEAVVNKKSEGVAEVVQQYREMVGLDLIKNASAGIKENEHGGLDYFDSNQETAKKVDLITLPADVDGTNCSNCKFVKITNAEKGQGFCEHELIQLPVTSRMCCALWDNNGVKRNWDKVEASYKLSKRAIGPIAPMKLKKLTKADDILKDYDDSDIIVQVKYDGFKTQAIKDAKGAVKLYTRRGEDFTSNLPDLVSQLEDVMPNGSFLLGELVWEKDGKQSISDIQTVVGSSPEKAQEKLKEKGGRAIFYVYDLLWESDKDITKQGYEERYAKLKKLLGKGKENIELVSNYPYSKKDEVINTALKANAEGIVLKPKDSEYKYASKGQNEPHGEWAKFKPGAKAHTDEVILNKYSKGKDKLVFPMYQHKDSELFEVGKLSGMSKEDEAKLKKDIDDGKTVVVEITFQEKMPSGKFRHVGWGRFRPDKPAKEVKYSKAGISFLSVRQAESMVGTLSNHPELKQIIDSFCEHSGGTKNTHSIINYLREKLGNDLISFSDKDLINYIEERKSHYKTYTTEDAAVLDVGKAGTEPSENYEDHVADYISHG